MRTFLASAAVLAGAAFMFVAALGVARLPDLYTRLQAATKAATVGVAALMGAVAIAAGHPSVTIRAALVAGFFLLTSPVAAHAIARSAHTRGVPLARGTRLDRGEAIRRSGHATAGDEGAPRDARPALSGPGERAGGRAGPADSAPGEVRR